MSVAEFFGMCASGDLAGVQAALNGSYNSKPSNTGGGRRPYALALAINVVAVAIDGRFDSENLLDSEGQMTMLPWPTLLSPAGFAFAIWGLIYVGELVGLAVVLRTGGADDVGGAAVERAAVTCRRRYPRLNGEGDVTGSVAHEITYLHRDGYFGRDHGPLLKKITAAMARDWRGPPLTVRCVEHHVYTEGGGLVMEDHRDLGSSLSLSVLLSDQYTGGAFTTTENGVVLTHAPSIGDGVLFASETVHNVSTIESGERRALVVELWTGPATTHDRSK